MIDGHGVCIDPEVQAEVAVAGLSLQDSACLQLLRTPRMAEAS